MESTDKFVLSRLCDDSDLYISVFTTLVSTLPMQSNPQTKVLNTCF